MTNSKFKVGDRVVITKDNGYTGDENGVGRTGTVTYTGSSDLVTVKWDDHGRTKWISGNRIGLVPEQKFEIGKTYFNTINTRAEPRTIILITDKSILYTKPNGTEVLVVKNHMSGNIWKEYTPPVITKRRLPVWIDDNIIFQGNYTFKEGAMIEVTHSSTGGWSVKIVKEK